jgi:hypothetical protein
MSLFVKIYTFGKLQLALFNSFPFSFTISTISNSPNQSADKYFNFIHLSITSFGVKSKYFFPFFSINFSPKIQK